MNKKKSKPRFLVTLGIISIIVGSTIWIPASERIHNTPSQKMWERSPMEMWKSYQKALPPFTYTLENDSIVASSFVPGKQLRRIQIQFVSQIIDGIAMGQRAVIYMPADKTITHSPKRLGKVVIIGWREEEKHAEFNYAEQIASKTDYPAMVVLNPGTFKGQPGETEWFHFFGKRHRKSKDAMDHRFFRMAVPYMRAMDIFSEILQEKNIRAILGGHSKRATSAYTAAAMDPKRVAGVVLLSNEAPFYLPKYREGYLKPVSIIENQKYIQCPVIYIGATNEDGYEMFNINRIQASLKKPWTLEIIPNHQHSTDSEVQFTNWMMWVSHVFDGRPLTQIRDLSYEETPTGTVFRAHIDSPNKLIDIRFWYVYNDDPAFWRDLVWYRAFYSVHKKSDTLYEAHVMGKLPDAWMVEVKDSALGVPGYVSSMPQDITHQETKWRPSRGQRSRLWEEKK